MPQIVPFPLPNDDNLRNASKREKINPNTLNEDQQKIYHSGKYSGIKLGLFLGATISIVASLNPISIYGHAMEKKGRDAGYAEGVNFSRLEHRPLRSYSHDFNDDGIQDLLLVGKNDNQIMLGEQDGSFIDLNLFFKQKVKDNEANPFSSLMYNGEFLNAEINKIELKAKNYLNALEGKN